MTEQKPNKEDILFADVILALHLPYSYTYRVPENLKDKISPGQRVAVQLRNKIYSAIVIKLEYLNEKLKNYERSNNTDISESAYNFLNTNSVKYVLDIIDTRPIVTNIQIEFFKWIADYYVAYIGDILTAALPASLRLKSETTLRISPYFNSDISTLDEKEIKIFDIVAKKENISLEDIKTEIISNSMDFSPATVLKTINTLIKKDVLITDEELFSRYSPKKETFLCLNEAYTKKDVLKELLDELDKSKKTQLQCEVILKYLALAQQRKNVSKSELEDKGCKASTIATLVKKGILTKNSIEISRLHHSEKTDNAENIILNEDQQKVFDNIINNWDIKPTHLIHGVTGSGKTEIYIRLIDKVLSTDNSDDKNMSQVLYLLPEIAITTQLIKRLEKYFGDKAAVYNSKFSMIERAEIWQRIITNDTSKKIRIIVGSRSSVFLPFTNLKLIIVDEEHDTSYKQSEPVPHYNGRDCALYLARLFSAKTILGSATPNIETYKMANDNKYVLHELKKQYFNLPLPKIELIDMKQSLKENNTYGIFSERLHNEIHTTLKNNKQVIIFQNRRGYAPHIECNICGYIPKCPNCDVSLVLHKERHDLECHYCGYHTNTLTHCPQCKSHSMRFVGIGTEKIEEELQIYFPEAKIKRMDLDSTRAKDAYTQIVSDFASHKIDILCGTQILTKGLDFENVSLVGVLGADTMLHYPDFRAYERCFQILTQVSGRAGRKGVEGKVLIQTFEPYHQIMQDVINRDYKHMYESQIKERQLMNFPPFCKMIKIVLQHTDRNFIEKKSIEYALNLRKIFGGRLFGPQEPLIARIKNLYAMEIWLKIEKSISYIKAKSHLKQYNEEFLSVKENSKIRISIDVDPV
ncbi:MAG: primosomal protein N' [Bacteroidales bacterium]|nr:primosomal protein N' [Bacteroidales bacterium]